MRKSMYTIMCTCTRVRMYAYTQEVKDEQLLPPFGCRLWIYLYFFICEILQSLNQFTISYLGNEKCSFLTICKCHFSKLKSAPFHMYGHNTYPFAGAVWYFCDKNSLNYNLSAGATMSNFLHKDVCNTYSMLMSVIT